MLYRRAGKVTPPGAKGGIGVRILIFIALLFSSCWAKELVVTTIHPLYLLVRDIAGNSLEVKNILPPTASTHVWSLKPKEAFLLLKADLVVAVGCNAEPWLTIKPKRTWYLCKGLKLENENPHVWIGIDTVEKRLKDLALTLSELVPKKKLIFLKNAEDLRKKLEKLREAPNLKGLSVVSHHDAWRYLCRDLHIKYLGAIEPSPHKLPSPRRIEKLIATLSKSGCRAVISEAGHNRALAERIAKVTNSCLVTLYPMGTGREKGFTDFLIENIKPLLECKRQCTR